MATYCNLDCITARAQICNCPCNGANHGRFLATMADAEAGEATVITLALELDKMSDHNVDASTLADHMPFIEKRYAGYVKANTRNLCKCGCGAEVKKTFKQGHDARYHAAQKRAAAALPVDPEVAKAEARKADYAARAAKAAATRAAKKAAQ